jgi:hypothetical protein
MQRMWAQTRLKPHRLDRYMASNNPDFEKKAADIIGFYMKTPQHAAVFCVDEKTAIQALDRLDPLLPPNDTALNTIVTAHFRSLNIKSGVVHGMTTARHTAQDFISFLNGPVALSG